MIYPIFITLATLGVTAMITIYIFPKLMPIFQSVGANLPITTRALIFMSNFLLHYGVFLAMGVIALMIGFTFVYKKFHPFNLVVNRLILAVPIFGHLAQCYHMANFCRTMGLLLEGHVGIISATNITADATVNKLYKKKIYQLA